MSRFQMMMKGALFLIMGAFPAQALEEFFDSYDPNDPYEEKMRPLLYGKDALQESILLNPNWDVNTKQEQLDRIIGPLDQQIEVLRAQQEAEWAQQGRD